MMKLNIAPTMTYIPCKVSLTDRQKQTLMAAYHNKASAMLQLAYSQLISGEDTLGLTQTQKNRFDKAAAGQRGLRLVLSPTQVAKQGGFLGPLLFNVAKTVLPAVGVSALQSAASALVNKAISGSGCNCDDAKNVAPFLIRELPPAQQKRALAEMKEGGFLLPLLAAAASSIIPAVIDLVKGKGMQVRPPAGKGYQVRPPKTQGSGYQVRPQKNYSGTL